jgi:hypothetical protein
MAATAFSVITLGLGLLHTVGLPLPVLIGLRLDRQRVRVDQAAAPEAAIPQGIRAHILKAPMVTLTARNVYLRFCEKSAASAL